MKPNRNSNPNLRPHPAIARLLSLLTDRAAALRRDPAVVAETIGYSVQPFHREWLQFQQDNPRTLLLAPRGHGKSSIAGIAFAIWKILRQPDVRILIASNTHDQARVFLREIRNHLECAAITALFGKLRDSRWNDTELIVRRGRIMKEATLTAAGANGSVVGRHFDVIIGDDIVDEENSWCEPQRAKLINWFHKVLFPCLEPGGEIHLIGTRYHEADLYGSIIQKTETETESGRRGEWESGRKEEGRDDGMAVRPEENEEAESGGVGDGESGREEHRKARMRQGSHAPGRSSHPSTSSTGSASSTMSTARHSSFIVHRSPSSPPLSPSPTPPLSPSSPRSAEDPASATPPTHPPASRRSPAPNEPHRVPAVRKSLLIGVHPTTPTATPSPTSTADTSAPGPGSPTPSLPHPTSSALRTPPSSLPLPPSPTPPLSSSPWRVLQHSAILPSGQPLWPGKYPLHELESFRREMGDILFS